MSEIRAFLPCRKGSERVPNKNIKVFAGKNYGLLEVKLQQLLEVEEISEVVLSTNDDAIIEYALSLKKSRLRVHHRVDVLSSGTTSTDELISHAVDLIPEGHILWTHVTSPFINSDLYKKIILGYKKALSEGFDSLMTTTLLHAFLWQDGKPLNYDRVKEKWPRTQTLKPIHEINSGVFLASASIYSDLNDRIGITPFLYSLDKLRGFDIDWPEDFIIAETLVQKGLISL